MSGQTVRETPTREEVREFVYGLFENKYSVRGTTNGQLVGPQTPCHDCFHADVDGIDLCIGRPIGEKFGILNIVDFCVPQHEYQRLGLQEKAFYQKYPRSEVGTERFTLERFADMMYDLVRIKQGQSIE